jgi:tetratricopeptide (TPR) repeat protein
VLEIDPGSGEAYYNLGVAYYNDEAIQEAVRFFERAIEMEDHPESYYYLGVIYAEAGDKDRAVSFLRERIRLRKGFDDPYAEQARELLYELLHAEE